MKTPRGDENAETTMPTWLAPVVLENENPNKGTKTSTPFSISALIVELENENPDRGRKLY